MSVFVVEDEMHSEPFGKFSSYAEALAELKTLATVPWDREPNQCPCVDWKTCSREYEIIEYDNSSETFWPELSRARVLSISAEGVIWRS